MNPVTEQEAREMLKGLGEERLLRCFKDLSPDEREALLRQIGSIDLSLPAAFREYRDGRNGRGEAQTVPRDISPIRVMRLSEIGEKMKFFRERGLREARTGKLAAVLLAGGSGTRLGAEGPKGAFDIGETRHVYIFQRIFENLNDACAEIGRPVRLFVMTSESNHEETVRFIREHGFFGYPEDLVSFFTQDMAPALDEDGHIMLESAGRIATSPNGNGGWFVSLENAGLVDLCGREGITWLNVFAVDNVLQRICDPVFYGAVLESGLPAGAKVVRKTSPDERVGVICLDGGRASVVEYYELSDAMRDQKLGDGSYAYYYGVTLNYLFRISDLRAVAGKDMPIHFAHKKIPCYDDATGKTLKPDSPNGWKAEYFIFDILRSLDGCLPFEVLREREFAPVKNASGPDSVETARELLRRNGVEV